MQHEPEATLDPSEAEYRERLDRALGDDYELRELIGRGGFGAVYAGWDRRLERDVAVKALRHDLFPTPEVLARFEREAKAVAKLRHPNILPVYTIGEGEGIAYMVMPLVDGENLRSLMDREGALAEGEAVRITVAIARALDAAHRKGFVHRDVKPENVLLEGEDSQVLLTDFGIARVATTDEPGLTGTGMIVGSPSYMSPEQARGETDLDHRSDLYQLGAVAYEMLTGARPFAAKNLHELVYRHVTEEPQPLDRLAAELSPETRSVVMACLEMDRETRVDSARSVAERLTAAQASEPLGGAGGTSTEAREAGHGLGTRAVLGGLMLAYFSMVISWFGAVGSPFRETGEMGEGFGLAVDLLSPFMWIANVLIAVAFAAVVWSLARHYRAHGAVSHALRHAFARPSNEFVAALIGVAGLVTVVHLVFIMPTLQTMAEVAEATLPASARVIIKISAFLQRWWWVVAVIVAVLAALPRILRRPPPSTGETTVVRR